MPGSLLLTHFIGEKIDLPKVLQVLREPELNPGVSDTILCSFHQKRSSSDHLFITCNELISCWILGLSPPLSALFPSWSWLLPWVLIFAAYQTESLVFHTNPCRGHFLLSPSLGLEMPSQMVPGPSSLLLVMETVSYPALSFMWLSQKTGRSDWCLSHKCVLHSLLCSEWPVCSYLPQAVACWDAFCLPSNCLSSPCHLPEKISFGASIWMCLATEPLCPLPLPILTPPTGNAVLCAHKQMLIVQYGKR